MIKHKLLSALNRFINFLENNNNTDFRKNGEDALLIKFSKINDSTPKIIFDVGANKGDWTAIAKSRIQNPESRIQNPESRILSI